MIEIRKLFSFIFTATFIACLSAQNIDLSCRFFSDFYGYGCQLFEVNVTDPSVSFTFSGEHKEGNTDSDVVVLEVLGSDFRFIPQEIFTFFPNIHTIEVYTSNLQSINVSGTDRLLQFTAVSNNISRIENGVFTSQPNITSINLNRNGIKEIEENAFNGLELLSTLYLIGNDITNIPNGLFNNTPALRSLDFERNQLTRIESETFSNLRNLRYLWLEHNRIDAISPNFTHPFADSISLVNLKGNVCVDGEVDFTGELSFVLFNMHVAKCFENHSPRNENDERRLSMEFTGRLNIYDRFNNLIGVINNNNNDSE
jgi:hypothetical protein